MNTVAAFDAARMRRAGSDVFALDMASSNHGAGRKEAQPLRSTVRACCAGRFKASIVALSAHPMMALYPGVVMFMCCNRDAVLMTTAEAMRPLPMRAPYVLAGFMMVPPRLRKLWMMMILLFVSTARTTMLASLLRKASFASFDT